MHYTNKKSDNIIIITKYLYIRTYIIYEGDIKMTMATVCPYAFGLLAVDSKKKK